MLALTVVRVASIGRQAAGARQLPPAPMRALVIPSPANGHAANSFTEHKAVRDTASVTLVLVPTRHVRTCCILLQPERSRVPMHLRSWVETALRTEDEADEVRWCADAQRGGGRL